MNYARPKTVFFILQTILIALALFSTVQAAGEIDPTFNGGAFIQPIRRVFVIKRQPDGKILIGGDFEVANGSLKTSLARLNADGSVDETFNPPEIIGTIRAIAVQADGKVLIGGNFVIPLLTNGTIIARLNADGSFDFSFSTPTVPANSPGNPQNSTNDIVVAADGKVIIAGTFTYTFASGTKTKFARLNADGTTDAAFNPAGLFTDINDIELQADGKIMGVTTDGGSGSRFIKRFNPDGTEDTSFNALVSGSVNAIKIQPDGKILIGGDFNFVNNFARVDAARLNTDGTLDVTFSITTSGIINDIDSDADGKILFGGTFSTVNGAARRNLARVDANGNLDNSFANILTAVEPVVVILPLPDGKILLSIGQPPSTAVHKVIRLNNDGTLDNSFAGLVGVRGIVTDIVVQPDGKILVAGDFGAINSFSRPSIARFNADGSADTTFNPPLPTPSSNPNLITVRAIALQSDGKILVGGQFYSNSSTPPPTLYRLNPDGSLDNTFNAPESAGISRFVLDIAIQPDGKIVTAPGFDNGGSGGSANRYNTDGSRDTTFNAIFAGSVNRVVLQPDGKLLFVGAFTAVNGSPRGRVARLNADGSLDATFNPLGGANNTVFDIGLQTDGKIVIGGSFLSYNGTSRNYLARLNADGNLDASFTVETNNVVRAIRIESNGKIIIGGDFTTAGGVPRNRIARLNADGTPDLSFNTGTGINGQVYSLALQPDNKIVVGGNFTKYNDVAKVSIVRLLNNSSARTGFDFDGDGRADVAVFRPSNGSWYILQSSNNAFNAVQFGQGNDQIAPADYDGDGRTDLAVFRGTVPGAGNLAYFYILNSSNNSFVPVQFGATGDVPISGDWDGDGRADLAVYRDGSLAGGLSSFYYRPSSQPGVNFRTIQWGAGGDKPLVGDFDGDGRLDAAVFRPSTATWYILRSSNNTVIQTTFGLSTDIPTPADYDGDGLANIAVFRPSTGTWFTSTNPQNNYGAIQFGANGDNPVPADYDGDGRADVAVFRPSTGAWYLNRSTSGFTGVAFGSSEDKPIPNAYIR